MALSQLLFELVDGLTPGEVEDLVDYLNMRADPGTLTQEELADVRKAEAQMARGEYVTLEELRAKYGD